MDISCRIGDASCGAQTTKETAAIQASRKLLKSNSFYLDPLLRKPGPSSGPNRTHGTKARPFYHYSLVGSSVNMVLHIIPVAEGFASCYADDCPTRDPECAAFRSSCKEGARYLCYTGVILQILRTLADVERTVVRPVRVCSVSRLTRWVSNL